jgi:hypothetical protein
MLPGLLLKIIIATVLWGAFAMSLLISLHVSGLGDYNETAAQTIQRICPIHLVPVDWIHGTDQAEIEMKWWMTEFRARIYLDTALWSGVICLFVWQFVRKLRASRIKE